MTSPDSVNILLVDDLPDKLLALESVVQGPGINVVRAQSGREALRRLLDDDFAVILLDVNMPQMDGFETARLIRSHRRCINTPIVFITAYADEMQTAQGYSLGAVDYILSPVVPQILRTKVGVFVELFRKSEEIKKHAEQRISLAREQAARAAAEEANRRKDQFLAMISHELRNPLAPIANALHILRQGELANPEMAEARDILSRQVRHLTRIADDLLDVFRIVHNKFELRREPLDLSSLVQQVATDHRGGDVDGREWHIQVPHEPVYVLADRTRIAQVVSNLLQNSIKFTNPGDRITVQLLVKRSKQSAEVHIRDTGVGIPADTLPYVFDIFAQADQGVDRQHGGLGLGLALVKGLVELHGGKVAAHSAGVGAGTEIRFRLPLCEAPVEPETRPDVAIPVARSLRVLVVEDNQDAARTLSLLLTRFGHTVQSVHSGRAGVDAAMRWHPDVVLCDLGLPELDGFEVARALRNNPATESTRLLAISGYGQAEDRRLSQEAGFDLHLTKPVDPVQLQQLLALLEIN